MTSAFNRFKRSLFSARQWYLGTSERALNQAYDAAVVIRKIENEHFAGNKISLDANYGDSVSAYFQGELKKYLRIARFRLMEFRASNSMVNPAKLNNQSSEITTKIGSKETITYPTDYALRPDQYTSEVAIDNKPTLILEKLRFIDNVLARYKTDKAEPISLPTVVNSPGKETEERQKSNFELDGLLDASSNSMFTKNGFIPRSIFRTANKINRDLDVSLESEEESIKKIRRAKNRTKIAVRFILLLAIVPLLTQQVTKNFIFGPIVDYFSNKEQIEVPFSYEIKEKILTELGKFEEEIKFERLTGQIPSLSTEESEEMLRTKAAELSEMYKWETTEPVKNILSDALSLGAFALVITSSRREIEVLKSFIDELVYGLSDSAKAFVIILFTDVFVGFHSTHGWEVIVENALRHFGLPENRDFTFMFIATFPVVLDAVFKYWIFRYLNQISPSAVATYRNMNE